MPEHVGYSKNSKISSRLSKDLRDKLQGAQDRLKYGMDYRRMLREETWRTSLDQYDNQIGYDRRDDTEMDVVNVNVSFSTINTLVPFVSDEDPTFVVKPSSGDANPESASLLQTFMNHLWRSPEVEGQVYVSDSTWDWLVFGDGFVHVGYKIVEVPQYTATGDVIENRGQETAKYFVERVSPWDLWVDPYSDGIHNARWVCRKIIVPIKELQADSRYKLPRDLKGSDAGVTDDADPNERDRLMALGVEDDGYVTLYEFYDTVDRWMMTFPIDSDVPFRYIEGIDCPVIQLANYRISNSPYHIGELENIYSLQDELNHTRSEMMTHRRRNIGKWVVNEDLVNEEAIGAMKSTIINDIVFVKGDRPPDMIAKYVAPQALQADAYMQGDIIRNDINEITGVNEYLRGMPQGISRTATEASIIEGATNVRTRHKLNQVEIYMRRIGQTMLNIISDTLPETDVEEMRMYITGAEAEKLSRVMGMQDNNTDLIFTPTSETFQGKYVVDVEQGSVELRNPQAKAAKYKEMATIMINAAPLLAQMGVQLNLKRFLELWFKAENIEDIDSLFAGDQQQQQQAMLQQQILAQQAAGQAPGGAQSQSSARGAPTPPGQPRPQTSNAPTQMIGPQNSGMLPPR